MVIVSDEVHEYATDRALGLAKSHTALLIECKCAHIDMLLNEQIACTKSVNFSTYAHVNDLLIQTSESSNIPEPRTQQVCTHMVKLLN